MNVAALPVRIQHLHACYILYCMLHSVLHLHPHLFVGGASKNVLIHVFWSHAPAATPVCSGMAQRAIVDYFSVRKRPGNNSDQPNAKKRRAQLLDGEPLQQREPQRGKPAVGETSCAQTLQMPKPRLVKRFGIPGFGPLI